MFLTPAQAKDASHLILSLAHLEQRAYARDCLDEVCQTCPRSKAHEA